MKNLLTTLILVLVSIQLSIAQLVITEISYNPPEANTDSLEYLELYNAGNQSINLYKYTFTQGLTFTFPNIQIGPNQYLLLTVNDTAFQNVYGLPSLQWTEGALNNSGEALTIKDSLGNTILTFTFTDKEPFPTAADGTDGGGKSIELCNPLADPNNGSNWKVSINDLGISINNIALFGTPGSINTIEPCGSTPDQIVLVSSNEFTPKDITINVGETVEWQNTGGTHNINGTQATYPSNPESFGNGVPSGDPWVYAHTFTIAGVYDYRCDPHFGLGMFGTVTVIDPNPPVQYPNRFISDVTTVNSEGVLDSAGINCTISGVVYGVNLRPAGLQFTIIDGQNNGIGVFKTSENFNYTVTEGDNVSVQGVIEQFSGLAQINVAGIVKNSESNPLLNPKTVTVFDEEDESSFIVVNNLTFTDATQWTGMGAGFNVNMNNGTSDFSIRIDNDIDAYAMPIPDPSKTYSVSGILSQFDNSAPYTSGYQLMPRYIADFAPVSSTEEAASFSISISPNPVGDILHINGDEVSVKIEVFDITGKKVLEETNTNTIQVSNLGRGTYVLKVYDGQNTKSSRFIKM